MIQIIKESNLKKLDNYAREVEKALKIEDEVEEE